MAESTSVHVVPSVLVATVKLFTNCLTSLRPCMTTPIVDVTSPRSICTHSPALEIDADQACGLSSMERAWPVPTSWLAKTEEYVRLFSATLTTFALSA